MKSNKKKSPRNFLNLTPAERDREVARFDLPIDIEKDTRPLTPKERAIFEQARRTPSASICSFKMDRRLVEQSISAARKGKMSLDRFIVQAIREKLGFNGR